VSEYRALWSSAESNVQPSRSIVGGVDDIRLSRLPNVPAFSCERQRAAEGRPTSSSAATPCWAAAMTTSSAGFAHRDQPSRGIVTVVTPEWVPRCLRNGCPSHAGIRSEGPATMRPLPPQAPQSTPSRGRVGSNYASHGCGSIPATSASTWNSVGSGWRGLPKSSSTSHTLLSGRINQVAPIVPKSGIPP